MTLCCSEFLRDLATCFNSGIVVRKSFLLHLNITPKIYILIRLHHQIIMKDGKMIPTAHDHIYKEKIIILEDEQIFILSFPTT